MGIKSILSGSTDLDSLSTLTPAQVEAKYGLDQGTLANWRYRKQGPAYIKIGEARCSKILYRRSAIEQWLNDNQVRTIDNIDR